MNEIIRQSIILAVTSLKKHKLRTLLSVLGTSIGIMSLIVIMSAGVSLRAIFTDQLKAFGNDYIQVEIKIPNTSHTSSENATGQAQGISVTTLKLKDKESLDRLPNVRASYAAVIGQGSISSLYEEKNYNFMAVSSGFFQIDPTGLQSGRSFGQEEDDSLAKVIVLGSDAAKKLFPNQSAVGQSIKLQKTNFRVIGVMNERGSSGFVNMDEWSYIPLQTAQKIVLGYDHLAMILAQLKDISQDQQTAEEAIAVLRQNHEITDPNKDDFAVTTQAEAQAIIGTILDGVTLVLSIIASIALLVGGVGIMNIMYVAVSERYFEIGLRKAVGARARHIRSQFLIEAIVVTLFGGIFGIISAILMITLLFGVAQAIGFSWPFAISIPSIFVAIIFSSAVGLTFGYFPARKAATLPPVEALMSRGM